MSKSKNYFFIVLTLILISLCIIPAGNASGQNENSAGQKNLKNKILASEKNEMFRPVMAILPREIDLGTIGPGDTASGMFTIKNMGSGIMSWSTAGPEGWKVTDNKKLSGTVVDDAEYLRMEIQIFPSEQSTNGDKPKKLYSAEIKLENDKGKVICKKNIPAGNRREAIKIISAGGLRTIFVAFKVVASADLAQINLNPVRLDMGSALPGKIVSKKIRLTNKGKEMLRWSVDIARKKRSDNVQDFLKKGRFISFVNEEIKGNAAYCIPANLKESLEVAGKWETADGYPSSRNKGDSFKFRFNGSGISVYYSKYPDNGSLMIYLDERLINEHEWFADQKESNELLVADNLADGPHVLTFVNKEGHVDVEGIKILGKDIIRGPSGWMTVFPNSGTTTLETEYINVTLNTTQLVPDIYGDLITFNSNGGEGIAEVFIEVISDKSSKTIDIYRYAKNLDYLFTANPQAETKRLNQNAYVRQGIAFRLFVPDTPGTTSFYRWYNPQKKDHFYHYDIKGDSKILQGYVLEGSIGNIATSKMTNTKELYRWFNQATGHYFFTTDSKGENVAKKGYRFDGIAGYVK